MARSKKRKNASARREQRGAAAAAAQRSAAEAAADDAPDPVGSVADSSSELPDGTAAESAQGGDLGPNGEALEAASTGADSADVDAGDAADADLDDAVSVVGESAPGPPEADEEETDPPGPTGWTETGALDRGLRAAAVVAATVMSVYIFRLAPSPYLLDSSELVATTAALGVSHPPGHPSFHLLSGGALALPFGTAAYRVHLAVAFFSALTLAALPLCAALLGWVRSRTSLWFASTIAVALAFTPAFAGQSIRAEVYSLNALCLALATTLLCVRPRGRPFATTVGAAVALGVGLLNHHYLILLAFPAMFVGVVTRVAGSRTRHLMGGTVMGALLLGGYLYLPLRAFARPSVGWGWPDSFADVYWIVSAQAFQKTAAGAASVDLVAGLSNVGRLFAESLTAPVLAGALLGLVVLLVRETRLAVLLALALAGNIASQTFFEFDPANPDVLGYFMPSFWWLALALIYVVSIVELPGSLAKLTQPVKVAFGAVVLGGIALSAAGSTWSVDLDDYWDSEYFRDEALNGLLPDSIWITAYFETGFNTWYGTAVEDRRPDVTHIHQAFVTYPFYEEMVSVQAPSALELLGEDPEFLVSSALVDRARHVDVRIESESVVPPELARLSIPSRLYLHLLPEEPPVGAFPRELAIASTEQLVAVRARFPLLDPESPDQFEVQTGRNLLWAHFNLALQMCAAERHLTCRAMIHEARKLAPHSPDLAQLAERLEAEAAERNEVAEP